MNIKDKPMYKRFLYDPVKEVKKLEDSINEIADQGYVLHTTVTTSQGTLFIFEADGASTRVMLENAWVLLNIAAQQSEPGLIKTMATDWLANPYKKIDLDNTNVAVSAGTHSSEN